MLTETLHVTQGTGSSGCNYQSLSQAVWMRLKQRLMELRQLLNYCTHRLWKHFRLATLAHRQHKVLALSLR